MSFFFAQGISKQMERPAVMAFAKATAVQRTILKGGARVSSVHIVLR